MADKKYAGENGLSAIFAQIKAAIAGKADIGLINSMSDDIEELQDGLIDNYKVMGEMGAKNLIPYPYVFRTSINRGITFTANDDGTVSFSGTPDNANPSVVNMITRSMFKLKKGSYTLSGGSNSYGGISIYLYDDATGTNYTGNYTGLLKNSSNQIYTYTTLDGNTPTSTNLYGYDKTFTIDKDAYLEVQARSMTNSYAQLVSGVIYPTIRLASDTDDTYQPYAKTNKQLTDDVTELQNGLTVKTKTLTPSVIAAGGYQSFEDADLKNVAVVGYWIGGVAGFNVTVISIISDGSGLHLVVKNNGETSVTPSSISVKYIG